MKNSIAVGYSVNSAQVTQFRIWATQTLKEGADAEAVDRGGEGESVLNYDLK